jgi:hypothetical protein
MSGLLTPADIPHVQTLLSLPGSLGKSFVTKRGTTVIRYTTADNVEFASITVPPSGYGRVTLRGSYFDRYPGQSINGLRDYLYSRKGNVLRVDVSLLDTDGHIDFDEYRRMSSLDHYQDYCTGSSVACRKQKKSDEPGNKNRQGIPDVHANHRWIHYGDVDSKTYAKLYVTEVGATKFEITLADKIQARILLDSYNSADMTSFNAQAKAALVKTINFVTPVSKRGKRPVQVESYAKFLGGEVKPIRWTDHTAQRHKVHESFTTGKTRIISQLWNFVSRFQLPRAELEEIVQRLSDQLDFQFGGGEEVF